VLDSEFPAAWRAAPAPVRRSLEMAYASLASGGLACGAVLTDARDRIVAEGRNRAYDPPGGVEILQGTPLAHAELNVLAVVPTSRDLGADTLWSTQEPCAMCSAAAAFTGIGQVRYLAPDPSADEAEARERAPASSTSGPAAGPWLVAANVFFLLSIASKAGLEHSTVVRNRRLEPETAGIVVDLVADGMTALTLTRARTTEESLSMLWDRIAAATTARERRGRTWNT
jgi:tRNA(Arg) A34 adenosine deaminase TadA